MTGIETKICNTCHIEKDVDLFMKSKKSKDGYNHRCKDCSGIYMRAYKKTDKYKKYRKTYRQAHLVELRTYFNDYGKRNRRKIAEVLKQNEINNPSMKIASNLRSRIWDMLYRRGKGSKKWFLFWDVTGCTPDELKTHIESQFIDGMEWSNHGRRGWHIDHILPCASFDLNDPNEQRRCFHYTNLQPLWWYENISKSDKIVA